MQCFPAVRPDLATCRPHALDEAELGWAVLGKGLAAQTPFGAWDPSEVGGRMLCSPLSCDSPDSLLAFCAVPQRWRVT